MLFLLTAVLLGALCGADAVQYPDGFRRWVHVGTGVILPGGTLPESEQGMHHIFANQKAVDGYASGDYPDGSIIVYELRQAEQKNGVITEGERRRIDVMIKDSNLHKGTGGWRFERFMGNSQTEDAVAAHDAASTCYQCHSNAKAHGSVFSQLH